MNFKPKDYLKAVTRGHLPGTPGFERIVRESAAGREKDERDHRIRALTVGRGFRLESEEYQGGKPLHSIDPAMHELRRYAPAPIRLQRWVRGHEVRLVLTPHGGGPDVVLEVRGTGYGRLL